RLGNDGIADESRVDADLLLRTGPVQLLKEVALEFFARTAFEKILHPVVEATFAADLFGVLIDDLEFNIHQAVVDRDQVRPIGGLDFPLDGAIHANEIAVSRRELDSGVALGVRGVIVIGGLIDADLARQNLKLLGVDVVKAGLEYFA